MEWNECPFCGAKYRLSSCTFFSSVEGEVVVAVDLIIECPCGATFVGKDEDESCAEPKE